jgi:hypothetical protein
MLAIGALGVSAAAAQACEKTWVGGSGHNGNWGTEADWSPSGVPGSGQSVCITAAGTYTVAASTGSSSVHPKTRTVAIAGAGVSLTAGATRTITLTLNATGQALLKKYGKLTVRVTLSTAGKTLQTLTVRVIEPRRAKRK